MRYATLAALLLACSSSATVPSSDGGDAATDARQPADTADYNACVASYQQACVMRTTPPTEILYTAGAAWNCIDGYDSPDALREAARACMCGAVGSMQPTAVDANARRAIARGCCGRSPAPPSAWCPDAG